MVVVTAAAGTGIGFATAKRCVEEGATVVISDTHERRLGEAADALAELAGDRPLAVVCNVTDEVRGRAPLRRRRRTITVTSTWRSTMPGWVARSTWWT